MPVQRKSRWPEVAKQVHRGVTQGLEAAGEQMKFQLIAELNAPKTGRIYQRPGRTHQASAPGEPPATDYGVLERSITVVEEGDGRVAVGTGDPKAVDLEFGSSRIAARPNFAPVAERMAHKEVPEALLKSIRQNLR